MKKIKVFAPASVANVACGFDVLGFALHEPGDFVTVETSEQADIRITKITGDEGKLPLATEKNTAGVAILEMCKKLNYTGGLEIEIHKNMPMGSGLGSSAASAVAAVVACNELLGNPLSKAELLPFVLEAERAACGAAHADNAAASLLGGFILARSHEPLDVIKIDFPSELYAAVVHPHIEIRTEDTRRILRKQVSLSLAVKQWANVGALVAGLQKGDMDLISRSLEDVIIEPVRGLLIPGFESVKQAALEAGALGCSISGSGPSIFALCDGKESAKKAGAQMVSILEGFELGCDLYISEINGEGAVVV